MKKVCLIMMVAAACMQCAVARKPNSKCRKALVK